MSRIDDTRDNIKTRNMSDEDRKAMFKKFVDHGGEVINERPKRYKQFDREKQRQYREKMEEHVQKNRHPNAKKSSSKGHTGPGSGKVNQASSSSINPLVRYFHLIRIRLNLFFRGVTDGSGLNIKAKFIKKFNTEYKTAIMQLQIVYIELFKNPGYEKAQKIIDRLDSANPLYFELIEMGADIYDRKLTAQIIDEYIAFDQQFFKTASMAEAIEEYFKRLYILYNYQTSMMTAYEKAFAVYSKYIHGDLDVAELRRKTRNSVYIVFNKLYPRLYWLFCFLQKRIISNFDFAVLDDLLAVTPDMKPGTRGPNSPSRLNAEFAVKTREERQREEEQQMEEAREEIKKKAAPKISEETKRGLELMSHIPYDKYAEKYLKNMKWKVSYEGNPLVKAYLVFQEFDEEYSNIFTTNKIKIAVPHDRRNEVDYKIKLSELYNDIRHIDDEFRDYFNSLELFRDVQNDKPMNQTQYLHYSKRLTELEKSLTKKESILRGAMKNFFGTVIDVLEVLSKDMEDKQKIVLNPQEPIEFDYELEGKKKLKGKKIYQAILEVIDYSSAFIHRLSHKQDLSSEASTASRLAADEVEIDSELEENDVDGHTGSSEEDGGGSILDELDKMF